MGRAEVHTGFQWGNLREKDHLEIRGVDGRIILKWILQKWDRGMDWINLAQDRDRWQTLFNTVDEISGNFLSSLGRVSFSGGSVPWCQLFITCHCKYHPSQDGCACDGGVMTVLLWETNCSNTVLEDPVPRTSFCINYIHFNTFGDGTSQQRSRVHTKQLCLGDDRMSLYNNSPRDSNPHLLPTKIIILKGRGHLANKSARLPLNTCSHCLQG